ncbi:hypothetical protein PIB30_104502, partial [Stylosanthes scabra]|nr:hypothetical protein [Stylosanthes scabra]
FLAAKVFYHAYAWMSEAWRSQSHILKLCNRDEVCELADPPRYAWSSTPMRAMDGLGYHA